MSKQNRKFEGVWIEKEVWVSKLLTLQEKCFFVEIKSLDNENGCFAGNEYFADFFQVSKRRCISVINALEEKGMIIKKLIYKKGTKQIERRVLKVSKTWRKNLHQGSEGSFTTLVKEVSPPSCRNVHDPGEEMFTDNNTVNSTSNNTIENESARAKKPTKKPKKEKPDLTADQTKKNAPPVAAHPPQKTEVDDSFLIEAIPDLGQPHWTEVATKMAAYFKDENGFGPMEWKMMCDSAGGMVDPMVITTLWAGKAEPFELLNWKKHTGKLTNWIKNNLRSDRHTEAKIKSLNKGSTADRLKVGTFGDQPQRKIVVSKVPV